MTEYAIWKYLHDGNSLATELPSKTEEKRIWLGVYPLDRSKMETAGTLRRLGASDVDATEPLYRVRVFEVDRHLNSADIWLCEDDLSNKRDVLAIGDDDLRAKLALLGARLEQLEPPFKSDYPI